MVQRLIIDLDQITGGLLHLTPEQQHYLYRVLRLGGGDQFLALDGQGQQWLAALTDQAGWAMVTPQPVTPDSLPLITLAIALPKGNGFDGVVRQATELGVTRLQPILSDRTLHHPGPNRLERWRRIAAEATEQAERLQLPQILEPLSWSAYLHQTTATTRWICLARAASPHLLTLAHQSPLTGEISLAIGPEGGWTEAEVTAALAVNFHPVSLGPQILRAVTAPLAALTLVQAVYASRRQESMLSPESFRDHSQ
ncbi:MAG: 16S rRNA (uracil(1498)-N(3))-methyltransferase [Nodosilinea sp.]